MEKQTDQSAISAQVIELYRRISDSLIDAGKAPPRHESEAAELYTAMRALAIELAELLNIEDGAYPTEACVRLKLIERELISLTGRLRALTSTRSLSL